MRTISADIYSCLLSVASGLLMMASDNRTKNSEVVDAKSSSGTDLAANSINDEYLMEPNANKTSFRSLNHSVVISQVGSIV